MHLLNVFLQVKTEVSSVVAIRTTEGFEARVYDGVPLTIFACFEGFAAHFAHIFLDEYIPVTGVNVDVVAYNHCRGAIISYLQILTNSAKQTFQYIATAM